MSPKGDEQYTSYELPSRGASPSQGSGTTNDVADMHRMGKQQELRVRARG